VKSNPFGPIDRTRLHELERRLGTSLPDDYRDYLIAHNGGAPEARLFLPPGKSKPFTCLSHTMFGLHEADGQLDKVYGICLDYLPSSVVAFAEDTGGNLFCVTVRGKRRGKIYFWDHHRQALGDEEPTFENVNLLFVAESFREFLNGLRINE
jgi:hypothetical protein